MNRSSVPYRGKAACREEEVEVEPEYGYEEEEADEAEAEEAEGGEGLLPMRIPNASISSATLSSISASVRLLFLGAAGHSFTPSWKRCPKYRC